MTETGRAGVEVISTKGGVPPGKSVRPDGALRILSWNSFGTSRARMILEGSFGKPLYELSVDDYDELFDCLSRPP
jgi:hypothetical protein